MYVCEYILQAIKVSLSSNVIITSAACFRCDKVFDSWKSIRDQYKSVSQQSSSKWGQH